jgi:hypothetical protein
MLCQFFGHSGRPFHMAAGTCPSCAHRFAVYACARKRQTTCKTSRRKNGGDTLLICRQLRCSSRKLCLMATYSILLRPQSQFKVLKDTEAGRHSWFYYTWKKSVPCLPQWHSMTARPCSVSDIWHHTQGQLSRFAPPFINICFSSCLQTLNCNIKSLLGDSFRSQE